MKPSNTSQAEVSPGIVKLGPGNTKLLARPPGSCRFADVQAERTFRTEILGQ